MLPSVVSRVSLPNQTIILYWLVYFECIYSVHFANQNIWIYDKHVCIVCAVLRECCASACNTDTTPNQSHRNSNTHRIKNNTTNVVIQQNIRKLLIMDILMSETC